MSKRDKGLGNEEWWFQESSCQVVFALGDAGATNSVSITTNATLPTGSWHHIAATYDGNEGPGMNIYVDGALDKSGGTESGTYDAMHNSDNKLAIGIWRTTASAAEGHFNGKLDELFITAETLTPTQIKRMYETGKRALEGGTEGVASSATSAHSAFRVGVAAGAVKYSAGQFIGSIIQVYDGPGSATSTRFITQTASSTADYYIQFSPDHSAAIVDSDTFSIGPNLFSGTTNRVSAIAVDDYNDFVYIGTTDSDGTDGSVSKIALESDTLIDVWHTDTQKQDDLLQPYGGASTTAIAYSDNTLAIANNSTAGGGIWSETGAESLDRKLTKPKVVFTVIDQLNVPRISANILTITTGVNIAGTNGLASSTSLVIQTATSTLNTIQVRPGTDENLLIGDDMGRGIYVKDGGNVGIGTAAPNAKLEVAGGSANTYAYIQSTGTGYDTGIQFTQLNGDTSGGSTSRKTWYQYIQNTTGNFHIAQYFPGSGINLQRISIDTAGNLGIGTTGPDVPFHVVLGEGTNPGVSVGTVATFQNNNDTSDVARVSIIGGATTGFSVLDFGDANAQSVGDITYNHALNTMAFGTTDGGTDMLIDTTGNVGIGTTTPISTLSIQGSLCVRDTGSCGTAAGTIYATTAAITDIDLAENYPTEDKTLGAGEVVMLSDANDANGRGDGGALVARARYDVETRHIASKVIGIVSTKPGLLLGREDKESVPVALSGRVPVNVSLENGPIERGDYLTLSKTKPGFAVKLKGSGQVIAIAMQSYDGTPTEHLIEQQKDNQVMSFVNLFYYYDDKTFVPIWDGKINEVVKEVGDLKKNFEVLKSENQNLKSRVEKLEKKTKK